MKDMNTKLDEVHQLVKKLNRDYPDNIGPFLSLLEKAEGEGALDSKTKELISIALSVYSHCEWCIAYHVKGALKAGATKDEILEACFVAVVMGGGPSLMYMQLVLKALEDYKKK